jgi:TPR repeat protein
MRMFGLRLAVGLSLVVTCAPLATGQTLEKIPFEKRLKLASVGDEDAQLSVGVAYETGDKAKSSKTEAAKWYRMAADQGNMEAKFRLARLLQEGEGGVKKDLKTAAKFYREAAEAGNIEAQNWLGYSYEYGLGLEVDNAKAAEWYRKSADAGLGIGQNNLGLLYLNGKGVKRDYDEAFKLFDEAAKKGDAWAINNLGGMYEMGWGTKPNKAIALQLYGQAAAKGNPHAEDNVRRLTGVATTETKDTKPTKPAAEAAITPEVVKPEAPAKVPVIPVEKPKIAPASNAADEMKAETQTEVPLETTEAPVEEAPMAEAPAGESDTPPEATKAKAEIVAPPPPPRTVKTDSSPE